MVMALVMGDVFVQVVGIDRDFDHIEFFSIRVQNEQAHPFALRTHEDEGLFGAIAAGFENHPLPARA